MAHTTMIMMPCITYDIILSPCSRLPMLPNEFWLDEVLFVSAPTTDDTVDCGDVGAVGITHNQSLTQQIQ